MKKIDFSSNEWKMQLYVYTEELIRNTSKFSDLPEYDLQDVIQDVYVSMFEYCDKKLERLGSVNYNSNGQLV